MSSGLENSGLLQKLSPASNRPSSSRPAATSQRVLACVLCQQRKVKCDRKFPCANCLRAGAECVSPQALGPRQRRRRFPERELLDRVRHYETLLRKNKVEFEPLHPGQADDDDLKAERDNSPDETRLASSVRARAVTESTDAAAGASSEPINIWRAMNQKNPYEKQRPDDGLEEDGYDAETLTPFLDRDMIVKTSLNKLYETHDHLLLNSNFSDVNLSDAHPGQAQIFLLWQTYLDNVDPLLKVTHSSTLQVRIITAASNVSNMDPTLEALMFSIYCIALLSIDDEKCLSIFQDTRANMLITFQLACQKAVVKCGALRSGNRESLTALFLYLISSTQNTDPRSVAITFGLVVRVAQKLGLPNESTHAKHSALEAEMRRRLWWAIAFIDNRLCEMSDTKSSSLVPTWDCKPPRNINDFDIRLESKTLPTAYDRPTEAIFAVTRSELSNYIRCCGFHLDFLNPVLKLVVRHVQPGLVSGKNQLRPLEKMMEDKYLKFCDLDNPVHFMTVWTTRALIAKNRLMEHWANVAKVAERTAADNDIATSYACRMLECDTKLIMSPLTPGFFWFLHLQFPFPAYIQLVQDLKRMVEGEIVERTWQILSDSYEARFRRLHQDNGMFFKLFATIILEAWDEHEAALIISRKTYETPKMVWLLRERVALKAAESKKTTPASFDFAANVNLNDFFIPMQMDFDPGFGFSLGSQDFAGFDMDANIELSNNGFNASTDWSPGTGAWL